MSVEDPAANGGVNWEGLARTEISLRLSQLTHEHHLGANIEQLSTDVRRGKNVEFADVWAARQSLNHVEADLCEILHEIVVDSPDPRVDELIAESDAASQELWHLAYRARKGDLRAQEVEHARESLEEAIDALEEIESSLEN